jgi:pimeloyl-ACP methyl ester carboxylesterase
MTTFAWSFLILAAGLYGAFCLVLFLTQAKLIFYPEIPSRHLTASPADIGLEYESVTLSTSDDVQIHGWFVPAPGAKGTLLFFHGNAGNISHRLDSLTIFHDLGLSCLIIDYRGYGRSGGTVSEQGTYLDAEAAWGYLAETRKIPARQIVVFGRSLGAAIAAYTASRHRPAGLILESAFTSVPDMGARLYPFLPVRLLSRFAYDSRKTLGSVACPLLVIHSRDDRTVPYENGRLLYEGYRGSKRFLEIQGDHNGGFLSSRSAYSAGIGEFVTAALAVPEEADGKEVQGGDMAGASSPLPEESAEGK